MLGILDWVYLAEVRKEQWPQIKNSYDKWTVSVTIKFLIADRFITKKEVEICQF
jgi:hypothetical protein